MEALFVIKSNLGIPQEECDSDARRMTFIVLLYPAVSSQQSQQVGKTKLEGRKEALPAKRVSKNSK
jgi:hypothetical protein